ncbi:hypothetical protein [Paratractidigestivibacter sp.]|uniref:hypothetical protein n=1 Tax=Paratractidigestivibacter sp. TaxID=2847316 RepID=UPI002ABD394E|nr:hypothetical protein [Paratractidigestivibacter sp.]
MLFRKRERFERTDVPAPGPYTNTIGGVVLAVVAIALVLTVSCVADRVGKEARLNDSTLGKQVSNQSYMTVTDDSYSISQDSFTKILLLTVSGDGELAKGAQLQSAHVLVIREHVPEEGEDESAASITAQMANVGGDVKVTASAGTSSSLAELCASSGPAACVTPLNAALNVKFSHVVVSTEDVLARVAALAGTDSGKLVDDSLDLVMKIRTDMTAAELVALGNKISQLGGVEAIGTFDAPTKADTAQAEDGSTYETGYQAVDKTWLCIMLGTLVEGE